MAATDKAFIYIDIYHFVQRHSWREWRHLMNAFLELYKQYPGMIVYYYEIPLKIPHLTSVFIISTSQELVTSEDILNVECIGE